MAKLPRGPTALEVIGVFSINLLRAEPCVTTSFDMRVKRRSIARLLKEAREANSSTWIAALDTGDFKLRHLTTTNANMVQDLMILLILAQNQ